VVAFYVNNFESPTINLLEDKIYSTATGALFMESVITTFIFGVVALTLISTDVTFVELELQVWFAIPILYAVVAILTDVTIGPNPFFSLIIPLFGCHFGGNWDLMTVVWPLIVAPVFGSFAAVLFFEFFYRKLVFIYKRQLRD
jgi:glycerol uptake facilitator-like aquaporin